MSYNTRQAVRKEAGFQEVETEVLAGVVDGSNKNFAFSRLPIVDNNNDDADVGVTDVVVRVNGVPVDLSEVVAETGVVTLIDAPAEGDEVTGVYASSPLTDDEVDDLNEEADAIVNGALSKFIATPVSADTDNGRRAKRIALYYAAGFALIRDYGKNTDTEETSKDGYAKLDTAKDLLNQLVASIKDNSDSSTSGGSAVAVSEGHPLSRHHSTPSSSHDYFMRKRC